MMIPEGSCDPEDWSDDWWKISFTKLQFKMY